MTCWFDSATQAEFMAKLGHLYEHSPWAAERAFAQRPFGDQVALCQALRRAVDDASPDEQLALIRAHPELAGEKLRPRDLTDSSKSEQAGLTLDAMSDADLDAWTEANRRYRERFGFPFIICVRLHTRHEIVAALDRRLASTLQAEHAEALRQIHDIARLRLADVLASLP
jgi:OHCU decarboxylase